MKVRIFILFLLLGLAILSGCSSKAYRYYQYPGRSDNFKLEMGCLDEYLNPSKYFNNYYEKAKTDDEKRKCRDKIINAHIFAIDLYFYESAQITSLGRTSFNLGSDLAVLGLGIAGSVVPATTTKNVLTPIITGITGAKTPIDKHLFYEQSMPVLIAKCEALRKVRLNEIQKGMLLGVDQYDLTAALADLEQYFQAGTIPYSLVEIAASSGEQAKEAEKEIRERRMKPVRDEPGASIRKFLMPDGKLSPSNQEKIVAILKSIDIPVRDDHKTIDILNFSYDPQYIEQRKKVAELLSK